MSPTWKFVSNLGYFGSGIMAATLVYNFKTPPDQPEVVSNLGGTLGPLHGGKEVTHPQKNDLDCQIFQDRLDSSIKKAEKLCERVKTKHGLPGLSVSLSVNGTTRWTQGFGYADLENGIKMEPETVVRIASISKSMTMAMLGKFIEKKKIDLDLPVQKYVPKFPKKEVDGKEVTITTRHLLSHLSGIRHYSTKDEADNQNVNEMELKEYFLKEKFESVDKSLELFQNDQLFHEPGTKFLYTTHGWTLVSAVLEMVSGKPFEKYAQKMFKTWGLKHTFLDEYEPIIYHRARPYCCNEKRTGIQNSRYVDNSYKWAGGGFLSNAGDLVQFGNIMLASFQNQSPVGNEDKTENKTRRPGSVPQGSSRPYLKSKTVEEMWRGDPRTVRPSRTFVYGLGFQTWEPMRKCFFCRSRNLMTVGHSGAAIGGSSVLLLTFPKDTKIGYDQTDISDPVTSSLVPNGQVKGVVVSMLTNLTGVALTETAQEITQLFEWLI